MLNQASREALYSATYLEDYLDCVENMPDDLQRSLTRLRELDIRYQSVLGELERRQAAVRRESNEQLRTRCLLAMQRALIALQEAADEKLQLLQSVHDLVDGRCRQLELDYKNLDYGKDQENQAPSGGSRSASPPAEPPSRATPASAASALPRDSTDARDAEETPTRPAKQSRGTGSAGQGSQSRAASAAKRRKRKARQGREDSPMDVPIEPDEPTYCLCEQVFFGEMIGCDNELCPIEWFHFACVNIVHKPKGKWYCPRCRGDRTTVMKPKHVFLRELDHYNKQKREDSDRGRSTRD
ncbi:inhibitor of growth protein 1-like [Amphibalanus amphitrite]|uniref:inhibitor of growth protein 1-like n=1 Tax=Amphibalanus amphitrite TaxID=1232801 RepID=UPI001C921F17|nr:inhibitor of growth protein 1-like [Amphibalanus amphitrite]